MLWAFEDIEPIDMVEVQGVFYAPTDKPLPPPISPASKKAINPNVIYDAPPAEGPKESEPLKFSPKIPPRRKPG
jgi:hypothetical protein